MGGRMLNDYDHNLFLFGYDEDEKVFYVKLFDDKERYTVLQLKFDEFLKAYNNVRRVPLFIQASLQ